MGNTFSSFFPGAHNTWEMVPAVIVTGPSRRFDAGSAESFAFAGPAEANFIAEDENEDEEMVYSL